MKTLHPSQYPETEKVLLAVDCIIFGVEDHQLKLLVFKREVAPLAGQWSLLGAFVQQAEAVNDAARRVLYQLTGFEDVYMEQLYCFGAPARDPGGRVISVAFWSLIKVDRQHREFHVQGHEARWVAFDALPPLVLDHSHMVEMAIQRLRERARFYPIGFELLPEEFTLRQLLQVYEAIYARPIDDRNFRKRLLKSGLVQRLDKKDKSTSKKGSYLYQFDRKRYQQLQQQGYNFEF